MSRPRTAGPAVLLRLARGDGDVELRLERAELPGHRYLVLRTWRRRGGELRPTSRAVSVRLSEVQQVVQALLAAAGAS